MTIHHGIVLFVAGCFSLQSPSSVKQKSDDRTVLEVAPSGHQLNRPSAHGFGDSLAQLKAAGHQLNVSLAHQLLNAFSPTPGDTFKLGEKFYMRSTMQEALDVEKDKLQELLIQFTKGLGAERNGFLTWPDIVKAFGGRLTRETRVWFVQTLKQYNIRDQKIDFCAFALSVLSEEDPVDKEPRDIGPCYYVLEHPIDVQSATLDNAQSSLPTAQVTATSGGESLALGGGSLDTFDLGGKSYKKSEVRQVLHVDAEELEQILTAWEGFGAGEKGFLTLNDMKKVVKTKEPQMDDDQIDRDVKTLMNSIKARHGGKIDFCAFAYKASEQKFSIRDCYTTLKPPASKIDSSPSTPEVQTSLPVERSPDERLIQLVIKLGVDLGNGLRVPQWTWDRDVVEKYWGLMGELEEPDDNDLINIDSLSTVGGDGIDPDAIALLKEDLGAARPKSIAAERDGKMDLCEFALWFKMDELMQEFPILRDATERRKHLARCYEPSAALDTQKPEPGSDENTIVLSSGETYSKSDIQSSMKRLGQDPNMLPYAITWYEAIEGGDRQGYITEAHLRTFAEKAQKPEEYVKRFISASKCFEDCNHRMKFYPEFLDFASHGFGEHALLDPDNGCCYSKDEPGLKPGKRNQLRWLKFFEFVKGEGNCYITESALRNFFEPFLQIGWGETLVDQQITHIMSKATCGPDNARINFDPEFVELAVEPEFSKIRELLRRQRIDI